MLQFWNSTEMPNSLNYSLIDWKNCAMMNRTVLGPV